MIKLSNLNKYFNRRKSNEIHVINNVSYEFPSIGLVAIMGQSGSGKTTLLNALCGLDKVYSGTIEVGDEVFTKYNTKKWDRLRVKEFGYIFQNYNLFEDMTVYENVAFSLELLGIKNKKEIEEKTLKALALVGLDKLRNRNALALSGGQMQRVAIARAIVKDPRIVIADEPTGNLDEANTISIMNILKKISKDRLVILVTHEKEIGSFYADNIINIKDGSIDSVVSNKSNTDSLNLYQDENIYLKDLNNESNKLNNVCINTFYSDEIKDNVNINVIVRGSEVFIQADSSDLTVHYDGLTPVKIIDDHKPVVDTNYINNKLEEVNLEKIDKTNLKGKYRIGFLKYLKRGFDYIANTKKFKKISILGFFLSALFLLFTLSAYFGVTKIDDQDIVKYDKRLYYIQMANTQNVKVMNPLDYLPSDKIVVVSDQFDYYCYIVPMNFTRYQNTNYRVYIQGSLEYKTPDDFEYTINHHEVVIDELIANNIYKEALIKGNTIKNEQQLLQHSLIIANQEYKIVGVNHTNNGVIYINVEDYISLFDSYIYIDNTLLDDEIVITKYRSQTVPYTYCGKSYSKVTVSNWNDQRVYLNVKNAESAVKYSIMKNHGFYCYSIDPDFDIEEYCTNNEDLFYTWYNVYEQDILSIKNSNKRLVSILFAVSMGMLLIPLIFLFFLTKSSMLSRVKETGVYRALGLSKGNVKKIHLSEAVAITILGSFSGWVLGVFLIVFAVNGVTDIFTTNPLVFLLSLAMSFLINLLVAVIPVGRLLRNTPYEILAKYDI